MLRIFFLLMALCASGLATPSVADVSVSASNVSLYGRAVNLLDRLTNRPKPRVTPRVLSFETLAAMPAASGDAEWACLREALYFEARGESLSGMFAVADVILNRVTDTRYPSSICGVIHQGTGQKFRCQFTYTCDGLPETMADSAARERLGKVAQLMISGDGPRLTNGATHYHTKAVNPNWARVFPRTTTIGQHHFYREPIRIAKR